MLFELVKGLLPLAEGALGGLFLHLLQHLLQGLLEQVRGHLARLHREGDRALGEDMGGFVCASHRRKIRGFSPLKRTLDLGIEKGRLSSKQPPDRGLIQVICYPASPETIDITGFFEKFCIAIRTTRKGHLLRRCPFLVELLVGIEPTTFSLRVRCSAIEPQ